MVDVQLGFYVLITSALPEVFSAIRKIEDSELFMPSHSLRCAKGAFPPKGFYEEPALLNFVIADS